MPNTEVVFIIHLSKVRRVEIVFFTTSLFNMTLLRLYKGIVKVMLRFEPVFKKITILWTTHACNKYPYIAECNDSPRRFFCNTLNINIVLIFHKTTTVDISI